MRLIAIDPGKAGGIAWMDEKRSGTVQAVKMPQTMEERAHVLGDVTLAGECVVYLEHVWAMPRDGKASAGTFMEHVGELKTHLWHFVAEPVMVTPASWIAKLRTGYINDLPKGADNETTKRRKNMIKEFTARKFPKVKPTLATSDALAMLFLANAKRI